MKLQDQFPNFIPALNFFIADKNPVKGANDSKSICYFLGIKNLKKAFDYYELTTQKQGGVFFRVYTMNGFKQIAETRSEVFYQDLDTIEWQNIIYDISISHLNKEECRALRNGYVKANSGCLGLFILVLLTNLFLIL